MRPLIYLLFLLFVCWSAAVNPGVKVRVTKRGMDYGKQLADAEILKKLKVIKVKDMTDKDGSKSWELKDVQIKSVTAPTTSYSLEPSKGGLTWSLKNFGISAKAGHWRFKYKKGWLKFSTSGSVDIKFSRVELTQTASFGMDKSGRPSISSSGCSAHIGDLDLHFHGGIGWLLNIFRGIIEKKLKKKIQPKICDILEDYINVDANKDLADMKITSDVAKKFLLDYRLVTAPKVLSNYLEIWSKGEISWKADNQASPFTPDTIAPWTDSNKMVYFWITDYTPNTFLYQAHQHNYLSYEITANDLPSSIAPFLSTKCDDGCIGENIPQLNEQYPNSTLELSIHTTSAPKTITKSSTLTVDVEFTVQLRVRTPNNDVKNLISLGMELSLGVNPAMKEEKLVGKITSHSFKLSEITSTIVEVEAVLPPEFDTLLDSILTNMIVPNANAMLEDGVDLPRMKHIQFYNTDLQVQEGNILVGTDVKYK